jgi:hypothetical protein
VSKSLRTWRNNPMIIMDMLTEVTSLIYCKSAPLTHGCKSSIFKHARLNETISNDFHTLLCECSRISFCNGSLGPSSFGTQKKSKCIFSCSLTSLGFSSLRNETHVIHDAFL